MGQEQHRATARVLDIVESLSEVQEGLTLTELAVALKAPKSSLFPIVRWSRESILCVMRGAGSTGWDCVHILLALHVRHKADLNH